MADKRLLDILNQSIARELAVSVQYMRQHVLVRGLEGAEFAEIVQKIAITEMKHAEKFAERLDYYGGVPTTKPTDIKMGGDVKQMLRDDIAAEKEAIVLYKRAIKLCQELDDPATRHIYEDILEEEEDHDHTFSTLLGE